MEDIAVKSPPEPLSSKPIPYIVLGALLAVVLAFYPLFQWLPTLWFQDDSYYAHGMVVPICSALIIWDRWGKLKTIPVKGATWAIIPIAALLYVLWFASRTDMRTFESGLLLIFLAFATLFVGGWRWLAGLAVPIGYLAFGLPLFDRFVDTYTTSIQSASTNLSYLLLQKAGFDPFRVDESTILVGRFTMDIGVACSGMKLLLAVIAICTFFVIVAKLKWWGNLVLIGMIIPLTLLVNSIRISMVGWVGATWGDLAGHQFHDYSGYVSLALCFLVLMKLTRILGWK